MFKFIIRLGVVVFLGFGIFAFLQNERLASLDLEVPEVSFNDVKNVVESGVENLDAIANSDSVDDQHENEDNAMEDEAVDLAMQYNLGVPFVQNDDSQAASLFMVSEFYKGTAAELIDETAARTAILGMIDFEMDYLGHYLDNTAAESMQIIDLYFGYGASIMTNPTANQIKAEIAAGRPVIVTTAGRKLENSHHVGIGPLYHYLVIKGYSDDKFVTHDPAMAEGENYVYDIDVIMSAIGDWNGGEPENGPKVAIFTSP